MPKAKKFLKKSTSAKTARAAQKPKRKRYPPTPGVDRRKRANNPRTGSRYVSEEAKTKILDTIGHQSLDAKVIAKRSGLSLTLVSCVVKHHKDIFPDKDATNAPREVDAFGKQTTGPRAAKYKLGKLALRYYEARQKEKPMVGPTFREMKGIERGTVHDPDADAERGTYDSAHETAPAVLQ